MTHKLALCLATRTDGRIKRAFIGNNVPDSAERHGEFAYPICIMDADKLGTNIFEPLDPKTAETAGFKHLIVKAMAEIIQNGFSREQGNVIKEHAPITYQSLAYHRNIALDESKVMGDTPHFGAMHLESLETITYLLGVPGNNFPQERFYYDVCMAFAAVCHKAGLTPFQQARLKNVMPELEMVVYEPR
jgi:hypothetical protein